LAGLPSHAQAFGRAEPAGNAAGIPVR